jgi:hypothetical protein
MRRNFDRDNFGHAESVSDGVVQGGKGRQDLSVRQWTVGDDEFLQQRGVRPCMISSSRATARCITLIEVGNRW